MTRINRTAVAQLVRGRGRIVGAAAAAATAAVVATVAQRARRDSLALPDPGPLAAEAATSVRNAAASSVIAAVRSADAPDQRLLDETVRDAILDGAGAGVDVVAPAVGAVEGAREIAHLLAGPARHVVAGAAFAAAEAAALQGSTAAERVRDALGSLLDERPIGPQTEEPIQG